MSENIHLLIIEIRLFTRCNYSQYMALYGSNMPYFCNLSTGSARLSKILKLDFPPCFSPIVFQLVQFLVLVGFVNQMISLICIPFSSAVKYLTGAQLSVRCLSTLVRISQVIVYVRLFRSMLISVCQVYRQDPFEFCILSLIPLINSLFTGNPAPVSKPLIYTAMIISMLPELTFQQIYSKA